MFNYVQERFAEYRQSEAESKLPPTKPQASNVEDPYVDFEVLYHGTDLVIDAFSMARKEVDTDFKAALIHNLSEVLEVHVSNIRVLAQNGKTTLCEISYQGKAHEYIKHEVRRITSRPNEFTDADFDNSDMCNDLDDDFNFNIE
jgi:hypothetical protein